jgi:superfamily II DNA or RNA helicase
MQIPYVIDNMNSRLADVLNGLLREQRNGRLDIATAYFSIRGYQQVRHTLPQLSGFRLLLGDEPKQAEQVGLRPDSAAFLRHELNAEPLHQETQLLVEEMIRFLRRPAVSVRLYQGHDPAAKGRRHFLHAKAYLFYEGENGLFYPLVGIVGSSNFTGPGLTTNRELNLTHKTALTPDEVTDHQARQQVALSLNRHDPIDVPQPLQQQLKSEVGARAIIDLADWYEEQWALASDYKEELIAILENSKFGGREYTPYEIYMKALYEYFRDDLDTDLSQTGTRSAVELAEFQEDAVKKARRILARYDGVIVADSVGLGKTWVGKKLLEDYAYHQRQKALIICPASLRDMWREELAGAAIAATIISQEALGQDGFNGRDLADVDVVLIDEAHNFRNRRTRRYEALETLLAANRRRGRSGSRKKLILLTATPINNNIFDLYNQINLFTGGDRTYFAAAGIGDLYKYFLAARRESVEIGSVRIFNLLEEVVVRRTRQFIRRAYPEATIRGRTIRWPQRQLRTSRYDLTATYEGFYQEIVRRIESLNLPHYNLESYKKQGLAQDEFELGRQVALVGIFKSRFLKRLESSIDAFRISIRRALEFAKTVDEYVQADMILDAASFQTAMRLLAADDEDSEENDVPISRAEQFDTDVAAREVIDLLPRLDPEQYDRRRLHRALAADIDALTAIWHDIRRIGYAQDAKFQQLRHLLQTELREKKVLIFSYYKDTVRYLYEGLTAADDSVAWLEAAGQPAIRRVDSSVKTSDRLRLVEQFAPIAHDRPEIAGTEAEIDLLVSTDVLSEGQNLQDCGYLINYDLHWNPTRMVQRAGRIDRLGTTFDTLYIYNMFPERELESLLGLVDRLTAKIDVINQTGFLDASVLGEVVTPRDFNTLRRIAAEDNAVVVEQESFLELASSEALLADLQKVLATEARKWLLDLDDGIHSGLERPSARGVFFYFTAPHPKEGRHHFWRYYDLVKREIMDNRYQIMQLIACGPETLRFPPPTHEVDIYAVQERIIADIIGESVQQQAAALVSKPVAEAQTIVAQILQSQMHNPDLDRAESQRLRRFLRQPLVGAAVQSLRDALQAYSQTNEIRPLVEIVSRLQEEQGAPVAASGQQTDGPPLTRESLHLVCYEYVYG